MSDANKVTNVRRMRLAGAGAAITGVLLLLGVLLPVRAEATSPDPEHKVTICHRTDSYSNPYVEITVDVASIFRQGHDGHDGPVFYPEIPKHDKWGDIIPAFDYGDDQHYDGMNLTDEGQAILDNGCVIPPESTTTTVPESTTTGPGTQVLGEEEARTVLPVTGTDVVLIAGLGVLLVLGGAALVVGAHRRAAAEAGTQS